MSRLRAVVFDLYGTLVRLERSPLGRRLPGRLGVARRRWTELTRRLLSTSLEGREAFADRILEELAPAAIDGLRDETLHLLDQEVGSARPLAGALPTLAFLKRRGLLLGLISNLASPYREPFEALGLDQIFDAAAFSCEEGRTKPDPEIYLALCGRLRVAPEEVLMVGDSWRNDVDAARRLGMRSLWAGRKWERGRTSAAGVGWLELDGGHAWLLEPGRVIRLAGEDVRLLDLEPVPDDDQGRYNLVMAGTVETARSSRRRVFFKRFLLPESAHVEAFAHTLLAEVGIETCQAGVLPGREPLFWSFEAPGTKLVRRPPTAELACEIGRHCASAYLFANADLRPRNAFLVADGPRPRLVMIDHEHCLFNLALDLEGISDPLDPDVLDAAQLGPRVVRRVLSQQAMRRARRTFLETRDAPREIVDAFRRGWIDVHRRARRRRARLAELLTARIHTEPHLVIGTRSYRRAMARIDVDDLLSRVDLDPEIAVETCL